MKTITLIFCLALVAFSMAAQSVDPSTALANFRFEQINYAGLDTPSTDFIKAIEHTLYRRYNAAEPLLRKVARQINHPLHTVAQSYLFNDFYFVRAKYRELVTFADELQVKPPEYTLASLLAARPQLTVTLEEDSVTLPVGIHRKSRCHVFLTVIINGKPRKFMLDTGFTKSAITQQLADELHLSPLPGIEVVNALNRSLSVPACFIDSLKIGPFDLHNFLALRLNKSMPGLRVDGVIGWDILQQVAYTIDFKTSTLTVRQSRPDATADKNLFGILKPFMVVETDEGQRLNLFYDSGSNGLELSNNGLKKLNDYTTRRRIRFGFALGQAGLFWDKIVKRYRLSVSHSLLTANKVLITKHENFNIGIREDGIISNKLFNTGRLTIDALNNHFHYEPNPVHSPTVIPSSSR
ncbi:retropepsin-like aspartic protease [Arsenicibacter rosenii]|uniref:Peptidase A2 domain-containing protein n=1 Tax=Arsenicibacter rosenii TaxID=1750698 RepID=A0A1S2VJN4_9BACT|nr:retropepsin-like aspartic protease [Arsenicibacter rosenii]OIN58943.1 hypothetical protein BLX24_12030 [Arsenicibacter rosenii]